MIKFYIPHSENLYTFQKIKYYIQIVYLRNKETQLTLRIIISIQYDARF